MNADELLASLAECRAAAVSLKRDMDQHEQKPEMLECRKSDWSAFADRVEKATGFLANNKDDQRT